MQEQKWDPGRIEPRPLPDQHITKLKFVKAYLANRLNDESIRTLDDFLSYIQMHTKAQNTQMMERSMENWRYTRFRHDVPRDRTVLCIRGRPRHGRIYATRKHNYMAWNALVSYARASLTDDERYYISRRRRHDRIPNFLKPRNQRDAYPNYCQA